MNEKYRSYQEEIDAIDINLSDFNIEFMYKIFHKLRYDRMDLIQMWIAQHKPSELQIQQIYNLVDAGLIWIDHTNPIFPNDIKTNDNTKYLTVLPKLIKKLWPFGKRWNAVLKMAWTPKVFYLVV